MKLVSPPASAVDALRDTIGTLPTALARIAKYILENPEKVMRQSVAELGELAGSGEASIVRLCRQLGYEGFKDFKLSLAAELARATQPAPTDAAGDREIDRAHQAIAHALETTRQRIDAERYRTAAQALVQARRIDVYGAGVSGMIAELLAYRLMRLRLTAQGFRDPHLAHEVASGLNARCVAFAISESGLTPDTLAFLKTAKAAGATTIALTTRTTSEISREADISIVAASVVTQPIGGAISAVAGMTLAIEALAIWILRLQMAGLQMAADTE